VGTSWPSSESRLAAPIPRTPGVNHSVLVTVDRSMVDGTLRGVIGLVTLVGSLRGRSDLP